MDALEDIACRCCDFWNGVNSLIVPVRRDGRFNRERAKQLLALRSVDQWYLHDALSPAAQESITSFAQPGRVSTLWDRTFESFLHPLDLQPSYHAQTQPLPIIEVPEPASKTLRRFGRIVWGRIDDEDMGDYLEAFRLIPRSGAEAHLALIHGQVTGTSPLAQSSHLSRAYHQQGAFSTHALFVLTAGSFEELVYFWNARARMPTWADGTRVVAIPAQALEVNGLLRALPEWSKGDEHGHVKPDLLVYADAASWPSAQRVVEAVGFRPMEATKLTRRFGGPPPGREPLEYAPFQWVDGPFRRGLSQDTVVSLREGSNLVRVSPPPELRFRHGGWLQLDMLDLPLGVPPTDMLARRCYPSSAFATDDAVSITTYAQTRPYDLTPHVPTKSEALEDFFGEFGWQAVPSAPGRYGEALIGRLDGLDDLSALASEAAISVLQTLAPLSRKKLIQRLLRELEAETNASSNREEAITRLLSRQPLFLEIHAMTLGEIAAEAGRSKREIAPGLAALVEAGFVHRGVSTRCARCGFLNLFRLAELDERVACVGCGYAFVLPIVDATGVSEHPLSYWLDSLTARVMDQDILPVLLALRQIVRTMPAQERILFWPGVELWWEGRAEVEVDLVVAHRGAAVLCECKAFAHQLITADVTRRATLARQMGAIPTFAALDGQFAERVRRRIEDFGGVALTREHLLA